MTPRFAASVVAALLVVAVADAQNAPKPPVDVKADTTWTGEVTVDSAVRVTGATLTIAPGAKVTFVEGGKIAVGVGGALVAKGTKENPARVVGGSVGTITCHGGSVLLECCDVSGMGGRYGLDSAPGKDGVVIRDSVLRDSSGVSINLTGPFEMSRTRVENLKDGFRCWGKGKATFTENAFVGCGFGIGSGAEGTARGNVLIRGTISGWDTTSLVVEENYVHQPQPAGTYGLVHVVGTVRNNVVRGGSWVTAGLGGEITRNVFISLPFEEERKKEGGYDKNCTHEHICGLVPNSLVARNLFVGASYGAVMGIGDGTCSDSVIRNNTFDMRGGGHALYLNHLPKSDPKNIRIVSNLFLRSGSVLSEKPVPDSTSVVDYNLWAASGAGKNGRFEKITMAGKTEGEGDFGGHDVPPYAKRAEPLNPADVVVNPDVAFPFSDDDMLSRRHTVAEVLDFYRKAYAPKPGSAAIDAGDPADKSDPAVTDGKPDIGGVEASAAPAVENPLGGR